MPHCSPSHKKKSLGPTKQKTNGNMHVTAGFLDRNGNNTNLPDLLLKRKPRSSLASHTAKSTSKY